MMTGNSFETLIKIRHLEVSFEMNEGVCICFKKRKKEKKRH